MRKKIFSALMLVAFFAATSSTLVSCKDYDEEISAVNTRIDNLDEELSEDIAALETQLNTTKTQLQAAIDANEDAIAALAAEHDADVEALEAKIASNNQKIVDLTARVAVLESAMTEAQTAIKNLQDTKADKSALEAAIADAAATHAALSGDIKALQQADKDIIAAYQAADAALEKKITAAYEAADKELAAAYAAADKNLQLQITANENAIKALQQFEAEQKQNNTDQAKDISDLATKEANDIKALNDDLAAFKSSVAETYATKDALAQGLQKASDDINKVNDKVNIINVLISKRLTSIVFAPNKYIDGVECIDFASVEYLSWGAADAEKKAEDANFLRDFPTDKNYSGDNVTAAKSYRIDDGTKTISYYVSPTGVKAENIANLEFIDATATNDLTRADADGVKLKALTGWTVENGKLNVKVTRSNTNKINNTNEKFTIVALKAKIAKEQLTEGETEAYVYSDWARLQETIGSVRIHNAEKAFTTATAAEPADAHFYAFSEIYKIFDKNYADALNPAVTPSSANAVHSSYPYDNEHIAKEVQYNKTLDLNSLDAVCDENGKEVDYKSYGLKFEHNLVEYNVKNENQTSDATNQQKYAKITVDANGHDILSSKAADGEIDTPNRDAVGKTPVIQVVLKDTVNNQVVDVRFYRIEWTIENPEAKTYDVVQEGAQDWTCNGNGYGFKIGEAAVNKFYAWASSDGQGYDQITFHTLYVVDPILYETEEAAKTSDQNKRVGEVDDDWSASQTTQAHNIEVTFDGTVELTKSLYDGTPVVKEGFIAYKRRSDIAQRQTVVFVLPVKFTITYKGKKIAADASYNQTAWNFQGGSSTAYSLDNVNKFVVSNPTLTTNPLYGTNAGFTDAQFINDLLNNYIKEGAAPTTIEALLANVDEKPNFVFDADRVSILPNYDAKGYNNKPNWYVADEGKTLYYMGERAAEIDNTGDKAYVKLYEGATPGISGTPSDGALLLVNYTAESGADLSTVKNAVPVKLIGTQCDYNLDMDKFLVRFEKPLVPVTKDVTLEVKDQITTTNIGGTDFEGFVASPAISGLFGLKEAFGQYRTVLGDGATAGLAEWYIVGEPDYGIDGDGNITNAKTNLQKDGKIGDKCDVKVSELLDSNGQQYWLVRIVEGPNGQKYFQFHNKNGNALTQPIQIQFEVKIDTKWLKDIKYTVTVTVKPNVNPGTGGAK